MTRTEAFYRHRLERRLFILAVTLLELVVALLLLPSANGESPHRWAALPESAFQSVPAVPGSAGLSPVQGDRKPGLATPSGSLGDQGASTPPSGPIFSPTAKPVSTSRPCCASSTVSVKGIATFYAYHPGQAAAALRLRDALGPNWRGMTVNVCKSVSTHHCIRVTLTDFESSTIPGRLIDLDASDWAAICGDLSRGVCDVVVSR